MKYSSRQIGNATLYLGDARDVIPTLPNVDAIVTDPPYGVEMGSQNQPTERDPYKTFRDTPENVRDAVVPAFALALERAKRAIVTPGTRCAFMYPEPYDIGAIYFPSGNGFARWGFCCSQPILYYGKDPKPNLRKEPNSVRCTEVSEKNGHPCPKPLGLMLWLVARASLDGETILDPFMGSGTTGVACMNANRKFIGIEAEPDYFEIACRRIEDAQRQDRLFA
jgi:site-specific DNA-methyltransferase (adenine-specific)